MAIRSILIPIQLITTAPREKASAPQPNRSTLAARRVGSSSTCPSLRHPPPSQLLIHTPLIRQHQQQPNSDASSQGVDARGALGAVSLPIPITHPHLARRVSSCTLSPYPLPRPNLVYELTAVSSTRSDVSRLLRARAPFLHISHPRVHWVVYLPSLPTPARTT